MGTLIGTLPDILIINFFGASVKDAFKNPKVLIIPGLLLITLFITAMLIRKKFLKD